MAPAPQVNLIDVDIYPQRDGAYKFIFEFCGRVYKSVAEFDHGVIHSWMFLKLIRQYFALRMGGSKIILLDDVPIESMENRQKISIEVDFWFEIQPEEPAVDKLGFRYSILDDDTGDIIAEDERDEILAQLDYPFDAMRLNECFPEDWEFTEVDFVNQEELFPLGAGQ